MFTGEHPPSRNEQLFLIHTCSFPNIVKRPKTARSINRWYNMPLDPGSRILHVEMLHFLKHISSLNNPPHFPTTNQAPFPFQLPPSCRYTTSWQWWFIHYLIMRHPRRWCHVLVCIDWRSTYFRFHDLVDRHAPKRLCSTKKVHPDFRNIGFLPPNHYLVTIAPMYRCWYGCIATRAIDVFIVVMQVAWLAF